MILVLKGVSLEVPEGSVVALLGANGAGKSTTLKSISNLLAAERGDVTKGAIEFKGVRVDKLTPNELVRMGVCQVMEGRHCFAHLTVEENLLTGAYTSKASRADIRADLEKVYHYFPRLQAAAREPVRLHVGRRAADDRRRPRADGASVDDPAGRAVDGARAADRRGDLRDRPRPEPEGARVVPARRAEHDGRAALREYGYILENGRVVMDGAAQDLAQNEDVKEFYLGLSTAGRKSFRDVKHYRRRKRWLCDSVRTRRSADVC